MDLITNLFEILCKHSSDSEIVTINMRYFAHVSSPFHAASWTVAHRAIKGQKGTSERK